MADPKSNGPDPGRCVVCREPNPTHEMWNNRAQRDGHTTPEKYARLEALAEVSR